MAEKRGHSIPDIVLQESNGPGPDAIKSAENLNWPAKNH